MIIEDEEAKEAVARIGLTPDGEMLYLLLQQYLFRVTEFIEPGALQRENGERILARSLMNLLSAGIDEAHASVRSGRIIVLKQPGPTALRRAHGAGRRGIPDGYAEPGPEPATDTGGAT